MAFNVTVEEIGKNRKTLRGWDGSFDARFRKDFPSNPGPTGTKWGLCAAQVPRAAGPEIPPLTHFPIACTVHVPRPLFEFRVLSDKL
jgi:hypothetical protein